MTANDPFEDLPMPGIDEVEDELYAAAAICAAKRRAANERIEELEAELRRLRDDLVRRSRMVVR
jgi:hypothetical protein